MTSTLFGKTRARRLTQAALTLCALALLATFALAPAALAQGNGPANSSYYVHVTNVTRGQILSPPIVVSHSDDIALWEVGTPASPELAAVAEDADGAGLLSLAASTPLVTDVAVAPGPLPPGETVILEVAAAKPFDKITVLGMLVVTNDAFFGVGSADLPFRRMKESHYAVAYDAGSEANNESCDFIPGPPCGNAGVRATDDAEGFVHVHAGIHGGGDLDPAAYDWRNPVARVQIQSTR